MGHSLSIVLPAYNEAENIEKTLERSLTALRPRFDTFEIIVIDDKSRDDTPLIAERFAEKNPEIRVVRNVVNKGQGETFLVGVREARYELLIHNAMDYPFDFVDLDKMVPLIDGGADIVVAIRKSRPGYSPFRMVTSFVNVGLLNLLFPLKLRDYNFVQLYKTNVLRAIPVETKSTAFMTPEIMIRANDLGYRIEPVEIDYHPRTKGVATAGKPKVIAKSVRDMLIFWAKRNVTRRGARS